MKGAAGLLAIGVLLVASGGTGGLGATPLRIVCEGLVTADVAVQDLRYCGKSCMNWGGLDIRVDGVLQVFLGAGLEKTVRGAEVRPQIESIVGNGRILVQWSDASGAQRMEGSKLSIRPETPPGDGGRVAIVTADGKRTLVWNPKAAEWVPPQTRTGKKW